MADTTTNLKLVKPSYSDLADIGVVNSNMDIIDSANSEVKQAAANAHTAANSAKSAADAAQTSADRAQTSADTAKTAADLAQTTANTAKTAAETAQSTANNKAAVKTYTTTIPTTGWTSAAPYSLSITIAGMTATMVPIVDVILSSTTATAKSQLEAWGCVNRITTGNNTITVYCYDEKPAVEIPVQLRVVE